MFILGDLGSILGLIINFLNIEESKIITGNTEAKNDYWGLAFSPLFKDAGHIPFMGVA